MAVPDEETSNWKLPVPNGMSMSIFGILILRLVNKHAHIFVLFVLIEKFI